MNQAFSERAPISRPAIRFIGNINSTEGTLEFWITPRWNGNDGQGYVVLRFGVGGGMYFAKDGANNWRSIFNRFGVGNPEVGVAFNVSAWQANQWHHAAFTWRSNVLKLYVDGQLLSQFQVTIPLNVVTESTFQLGADFNTYYLDAVVDELRLSDIERSAQEIQASFLAGQANPFIVTNTNDGGPGSLRQAILNANANPGKDRIRFKIPGKGPHTIQPLVALPKITDPVVIDGSTQPGFSGKPVIELDGSNAGAGANGLHITAGSSTVQGLAINRFNGDGIVLETNGGNIIKGNYIGTDVTGTVDLGNSGIGVSIYDSPNNTIGGKATANRNVISGNNAGGILIARPQSIMNVVLGNFVGTDKNGTAAIPNGDYGVTIGDATNNTIGGLVTGTRNVISGNTGAGVVIGGILSAENQVLNNFIGVDVTGKVGLGNTIHGVFIHAGSNETIQGNVISSNGYIGIQLAGGTTSNQVLDNFIGTKANGVGALGNGVDGVVIFDGSSNNTISKNQIAFNGVGVHVDFGTNNAFSANSIHSNTGLGIDLGSDSVTPNDAGDGDTGPNNLQNFPVLASAIGGSKIKIQGTLNSAPNTSFKLEFFSNPVCDPSAYGEGHTSLGSKQVTTDASGNAGFTLTFQVKVKPGQSITATATDPSGNTSEFSQCIAVTAASMAKEELEAAEENAAIPDDFALLQNYPNPFNPETEIRFALPQSSHVVLKIFNLLGEEIRTLVDEQYEAGYHNVRWDGKDKNGNAVASGVYLYRLSAGNFLQVKKMSFIR